MKHTYPAQIGQHFHLLEQNPRYDADLKALGETMVRECHSFFIYIIDIHTGGKKKKRTI